MFTVLGRTTQRDLGDFRYTVETATKTTEFWREKFDGIEVESLTAEKLADLTDRVSITPQDLYKTDLIWPDYIKTPKVFYAVMRTSGTTGKPKRIPYTRDDRSRTTRQLTPWIREYVDRSDRVASFFPMLPSSSGMFAFGPLEALNAKCAYYQVPIQYLQDRNLLLRELEDIRPTVLYALTATAYNLGLILPERITKDIQTIVVGGETLTPALAKAMLEIFENAVIIDNFGSTEDAVTGYRVVTHRKTTEFTFSESIVILKERDEQYPEYHKVYITKVMRNGELTGLPLFNYDIGDLARVENGRVTSIIRTKDAIILSGAKLHIDQLMDIVYSHPELQDFVVIYYPLSPENPKPKAIIRVGYSGQKPSGIEDEIREMIYSVNNPVRYEVEESKLSELEIVALPVEKLREDLPKKPGKTKRLYIVGRDI